MKILGAILAGGGSTRFGSDKALAILDGKPLLAHVAEALAAQVDTLVVCGRLWPGLETVADRPAADLGPLGGLCGALLHANATGHDAVLTAGCDVLPIPFDLCRRLGTAPAYIAGQPLFALWPASLGATLEQRLRESDDRSIRSWITFSGARAVALDLPLHNFNTPADLADYPGAGGRTR